MSRKKMLINTIAVTLTTLICLMLPVQVVAETLSEDDRSYSDFDNVKGNTETVGSILTEISNERTESTKTFLLDDGTKMIAEYNQPVHYKNNKGEWVEYNNSFESETSTAENKSAETEYTNKSSDTDIKLSNKAKENNMIKVTSDDYSISWGYEGVNKSKVNFIKNEEKLTGNDKFTTLKNIISEAKYENVYKNVDLQYFVTSTGVKENIILKSSDVQNEFNLTYKIKNLTAEQTDDYTITLYNKDNKAVYKILAPYMADADGDCSNQLKLELVSQNGGNLKVKLTADYMFIHGIGRSFPITIDPEITNKLISDLSLNEGAGGISLNHGPYYTSKSNYVIASVNKLPELGNGEKIVSAKFNFETTNGSTLFSNETDEPIIVNAHKLKSVSGNVVSYDKDILDYDSLTYKDNKYVTFDLTKTFNEWYSNGENIDGFILESFDTIGSKQVNFREATKTSITPSVTLIYKDFKGTESNLSYHTIDTGFNAQASVSDYLGNLIINQILYEGTGSRMPVTLTATYNSINDNTAFANGSPSGYGWQFSFNQYVREASSEFANIGYNYIYTDSDGTDHYLKKTDGKEEWSDEDGLGITLTKTDTNILIDNGSATQTYELTSSGGKLLSEKDEHNNTVTYTYTDGNVTKITDGSGRTITISYKSNSEGNKRVQTIKTPDNSTIDFSYTTTLKDKISTITFADGKQTRFQYDESGALQDIIQSDIYSNPVQQCKYTFTNTDGKITKITEYGSDNTVGNYLNIAYGSDNTTTFTDRQGRKVTYTFDNYGNKVSMLNANGYLESSESSGLSVSGGAESFTKNYITESTEQSAVGSGKYYYKTNGTKGTTTSSGGTVTIDTSQPTEKNGQVQYFGTTSLKVTNPVSSANSAFFTGATHQINDEATISVLKSKDITFSAYVKTKDVEEIYGGGPIGATLKIKCYDSSGATLKDINSIGINGTQDWQRLSVSVTVPNNTSMIRVFCNLRYASGTAWFDCLQLEEGNCANDFNALQNGNFESNDYWLTNENKSISAENSTVTLSGEAGEFDTVETDQDNTEEKNEEVQSATYCVTETEPAKFDKIITYDDYGNTTKIQKGMVTKTVKKTYEADSTEATDSENDDTSNDTVSSGNSLGNKYIYQNVNVDRAGVIFNVIGTAQAKSVPLSNENRTFGIALNIYYKNKTTPETHYQEFNGDTDKKQTVSLSIIPENENEEVDYIAIAFVYGYNENEMTVYGAELNIASNGYTADTATENTDSVSDDETADASQEDNLINYEVVSEVLDTNQSYMETSTVYDSTGNYVTSETDEAGNTVKYIYDVNGNITQTTDGEDNVTNYTYDKNRNLTSVSSGNAKNVYGYNGAGNIASIAHNSFSYKFNYDVFQNLVSTKIGNTAIESNTYDANNGNLIKTTYANGDYIQYTYDSYDNITKLTGETGVIAQFVYDKKGRVAKAIDTDSETTTYYYYDFNGNVTGEYRQTESGDLSYFISYNSDGNKVENTSVHGNVKTITRGSDENSTYVENDGIKVNAVVDSFDRLSRVITSREEGKSVFFTDYEYKNGKTDNSTTNLVSKLTQKYGSNQLVNYEYSYDGNGNIVQIKQNGTIIAKYSYDELNQLVWSADRNTGLYTQIIYDNAGNITNVREYNLSTVSWAPNGLKSEKKYTYGDTNWKDMLTTYNGTAITYDAMGNPLSYRDSIKFTWKNGRQLAKISNGNNTITMKYDSNGIRTQKDDDNYTTNYYYDSNNNLIGLNKSGSTLFFYYDSYGLPMAFKNNGVMYYYVKNLQGDIVNIVKEDGTIAVTYTYDALGKLLSVKDSANVDVPASNSFHIANLNPYRYRSYIYDNETGLYYLQSRYYDPVTGRFLNADDTQFILGCNNVLSANLFTYCGNNAVNNKDPNGEFWVTLAYKAMINYITFKLGINIIYNTISVASSMYNFFYNQEYKFASYIFGQGHGNAAKLRMGLFTGDYNGCGWVATFNAFKALGDKYIQPNNIISYFETWGCILQGAFGVLPDAIADYFRLLGYKYVDEYYFPDNMDSIIKDYRAAVLFYAHSSACHYIMVRYYNNAFYVYNEYNKDRTYKVWSSINKKFEEKNYKILHITGIG